MTTKDTGGPAYPVQDLSKCQEWGLTKRDAFAIAAMQGLLSDLPKSLYGLQWQSSVAVSAYELADLMLEARK